MTELQFNEVYENKVNAEIVLEELTLNEVPMILIGESDYPKKLEIVLQKHPPPVLFLKGNVGILHENNFVGFCGSRKVSEKGISLTRSIVKQLVEKTQ